MMQGLVNTLEILLPPWNEKRREDTTKEEMKVWEDCRKAWEIDSSVKCQEKICIGATVVAELAGGGKEEDTVHVRLLGVR